MRDEAQRILRTHASQMKQSRPRYRKGPDTPQTQLDFGE